VLRLFAFFLLQCFLLATIFAASHRPQDFVQQIKGQKDEGEQIVQHFCVNCHAAQPLIPLGAPRIGFKKDWQSRLQPGMAALFQHTNEGFNAMPARGGCFECNDDQLMLAIIAMLPKKER
jgi:cytochrome c5